MNARPLLVLLLGCVPAYAAPAENGTFRYDARPMPVCGSGPRVDCVHDGDTFWLSGEKIRLKDIDTPELPPHDECAAERQRGIEARDALQVLLDNMPLIVTFDGRGYYGRLLAHVTVTGYGGPVVNVEDFLLGADLAQPWPNDGNIWCE